MTYISNPRYELRRGKSGKGRGWHGEHEGHSRAAKLGWLRRKAGRRSGPPRWSGRNPRVKSRLRVKGIRFDGQLEIDLGELTGLARRAVSRLVAIQGETIIPRAHLGDLSNYLELAVEAISSSERFMEIMYRLEKLEKVIEVGLSFGLEGWLGTGSTGKIVLMLLPTLL